MRAATAIVILWITASGWAYADSQKSNETTKSVPQQHTDIVTKCSGWRMIAGGLYTLKNEGRPKPIPTNELDAKIIEEIYSARTSVATKEMAESMGEQFCWSELNKVI